MKLVGFDTVNAAAYCQAPKEGIEAKHLLLDIKASSKQAMKLRNFEVRAHPGGRD